MRVLLVTDIHANWVALEAVVRDAGAVDAIWCLGDVIGYGPRPNECAAWVEAHADITVVGNHDWAALGRLDLDDFNESARQATLWTIEQLTPPAYGWLDALPNRYSEGDTTLVHGSPRHPIWEYLLRPAQAAANFEYFDTDICFVGHTHAPTIFHEGLAARGEPIAVPPYGQPLVLANGRYIINPGSVGQPRDGDPRAAYALYEPETRTIEFRRRAYDIARTQEQMRAAGLPDSLVRRLARGL